MTINEQAACSVEQEAEFVDLIGFLQDAKTEVQRLAAEGAVAYSESEEFLRFCKKEPRKVARPLLRLAEAAEAAQSAGEDATPSAAGAGREKKGEDRMGVADTENLVGAGMAALQALVNLCSVPEILDVLVILNAPKRCIEAMRKGWLEGRIAYAHLYSMLLANLTTLKGGQEAICKEDALLRFLFSTFVAKPRPVAQDNVEDPFCCLGRALCNLCVLPEGRKALADPECGGNAAGLMQLANELADRGRRLDVLNIFRNLCLAPELHPTVVQSELMAHMALFLYAWEKAEPERRETLPGPLKEELAKRGSTLTVDVAVRKAASDCLRGLCLTETGRNHLRTHGCYEVTRVWHLSETDPFIKEAIEAIVPAVHFTEEQLAENAQKEREAALAAVPAAEREAATRICDAADESLARQEAAEEAAKAGLAPEMEPPQPIHLPAVTSGPLPEAVAPLPEGENEKIGDLFDGIVSDDEGETAAKA